MTRPAFRSLLEAEGPLILPGAHDALAACELPVLVDADTMDFEYGDACAT